MKYSIYPVILVILLLSTSVDRGVAQPAQLSGLWLVEKVSAGDREMTPIAKWTRINPDGTYESGNGWLQSAQGSWTYDSGKKHFLPTQTDGIDDPYGAFSVSFEDDNMLWKRNEEGMEVTVSWHPIEQPPQAPADKVQGLWDLASATEGGQSILKQLDPQNQKYVFLRWDRIYVERTAAGERGTGFWHMGAHSPKITLLSHSKGQQPESWSVSISEEGQMIWTGASDANSGQTLTYERLNQFPE